MDMTKYITHQATCSQPSWYLRLSSLSHPSKLYFWHCQWDAVRVIIEVIPLHIVVTELITKTQANASCRKIRTGSEIWPNLSPNDICKWTCMLDHKQIKSNQYACKLCISEPQVVVCLCQLPTDPKKGTHSQASKGNGAVAPCLCSFGVTSALWDEYRKPNARSQVPPQACRTSSARSLLGSQLGRPDGKRATEAVPATRWESPSLFFTKLQIKSWPQM